MMDQRDEFAQEITDACGTFPRAVETCVALSRALWQIFVSGVSVAGQSAKSRPPFTVLPIDEVTKRIDAIAGGLSGLVLRALHGSDLYWRTENGAHCFRLAVFQPIAFARTLLRPSNADHDLRYFAMRSIRRHYDLSFSARTAQMFQILADRLSALMVSKRTTHTGFVWDHDADLAPLVTSELERVGAWEDEAQRLGEGFLECCRAVNYLEAYRLEGHVIFRTRFIDAEFIRSRLFGLPTGIPGFDDLFGGGGIMLPDEVGRSGQISGRAVLTMGRFGTGKSILSLQMALEVARKGGIAWVMPLEQTAEECLYSLASIGASPLNLVEVATDARSAARLFDEPKQDRGALVFLGAPKQSFDGFLETFEDALTKLEKYTLRLVVVDPVNAVFRDDRQKLTDLRAKTMAMFTRAKRSGVNLWLIAEDGASAREKELLFEQNIADTVIQLTTKEDFHYSQRYFAITKSRLQREQRGSHPFSILPGIGFRIYPSSAAVSARISSRTIQFPSDPVSFGFPELDDVLGAGSLFAGDVVVLQGARGSFKTPMGLMFLLEQDRPSVFKKPKVARSLLVAGRDSEQSIRRLFDEGFLKNAVKGLPKKSTDVIILSIDRGFVKPGYILQRIEEELLAARLDGNTVDRVMIDNIGHMEMSCPFVQEDRTFGDTLVELLRRHQVTSLLVCGPPQHLSESVLQQSIVDSADCLIHVDRVDFRGLNRVMLRVSNTRTMRHRKEPYEVLLDSHRLQLKPTSSLLRITQGGGVEPVKVRLFLHAETHAQANYNTAIQRTLRAVLSQNVDVESEGRTAASNALGLGRSSAVDELQLFQLDEFQVPTPGPADEQREFLFTFSRSQWDDQWADLLPRLAKRVRTASGFFAIPLYENISFLAYNQDRTQNLSQAVFESWSALAAACKEWEAQHENTSDLFFDFPKETAENYNCLFLEILLSLSPTTAIRGAGCSLQRWLHSDAAVEAAILFRTLCRRSYLSSQRSQSRTPQQASESAAPWLSVEATAVVWRHWYSTLNQMMSTIAPDQRSHISVVSLPADISTAGEWYLAAPAYATAPDVGLEVMKFLTTREAELDRMRRGVGLPVHAGFYEPGEKAGWPAKVSPYFSMDPEKLASLVSRAFQRSSFGCYSQLSTTLAAQLERIIEIENDANIEEEVKTIFHSVGATLEFIGSAKRCGKCHESTHPNGSLYSI